MNNRITLVLVVITGILIGIGLVATRTHDPVLMSLASQQQKILDSQSKTEKMLKESSNSATLENILKQQTKLEERIATLAAQLGRGAGDMDSLKRKNFAAEEDASKVYDIPLDHSYVKGKADAPVTVVEFIDFQCPYCARFHPILVQAVDSYPNDVRYIIKNFPLSFHPLAKPAAKAVFAAGEQGKYFEMADSLANNQEELTDAKFKELAKGIGIDEEKFSKDYQEKDALWEQYINEDLQAGSNAQVRGTPTFYINGRKMMARDVDGFKNEIEKILKGDSKEAAPVPAAQ